MAATSLERPGGCRVADGYTGQATAATASRSDPPMMKGSIAAPAPAMPQDIALSARPGGWAHDLSRASRMSTASCAIANAPGVRDAESRRVRPTGPRSVRACALPRRRPSTRIAPSARRGASRNSGTKGSVLLAAVMIVVRRWWCPLRCARSWASTAATLSALRCRLVRPSRRSRRVVRRS